MLRKLLPATLPLFLAATCFAAPANRGLSMSSNDDSTDCRTALHFWADDQRPVARAEEEKSFPNSPLKIQAGHNGGIHVRNWDQPGISIKICKAASAQDEGAANNLLSQIHLVNNGTITVDGPRGDDDSSWTALLIVQVPKGATLDLRADNGGISVRNASLNLTANTENGGIALDHTTGKIDVQAQNGGISLKDCGGDVKVNVQNGGLDLQLAQSWEGAGLEAHTQNGGMVVQLPSNMKSGVEISTSQHTSLICQDEACSGTNRTWDDNRKILRAGTGSTVIRASTENGGVVIKRRGAGRI